MSAQGQILSRPLVATYRIQLGPAFGFTETAGILDHLDSIAVSHVYLSPVAEAVPGSTHGYDVVDHRRVREELGGEAGLRSLLDAAARRGMSVLIDHVPNHVSAARAELNDRWWATLRDGPASFSARWFDIDWAAHDGKVLVPKLDAPIADVMQRGSAAAGGMSIGAGDRGPELQVGTLRFPLAPGTEQLELTEALARQHYQLVWWRNPARNVRRFFTIDDLVGVRVEDEAVAAEVDTIPVMLTDHPAFAGVRIDHVDGLADPGGYLDRLRARLGERWILVEKILAHDETLPRTWPVHGTTGYEHITVSEHAFLDPAGAGPLHALWSGLTGETSTFDDVERTARAEVLAEGLAPDLERLVHTVMASLPVDERGTSAAHDAESFRAALIEITLALDRYRTYLPDPDSNGMVDLIHGRAAARRPDLGGPLDIVVDMIRHVPLVQTRWQQLTGPVMAKGAEDRAFYRHLPLASLSEVGGAPGSFGLPRDDFHTFQRRVQAAWPDTLLAGSTHDTKRSEDVRARSLVLAEVADDWAIAVRRWFADHEALVDALDAPAVLLALQTVVTAWPIDVARLSDYLVKASREAATRTTWADPDPAYEEDLGRLADVLVADMRRAPDGPSSLTTMAARLDVAGRTNSIAALAVRLMSPGVPDLYQGSIAYSFTLVDPDNRVPPDWNHQRAIAERAAALDGPTAWALGLEAAPFDTTDDLNRAVLIGRLLRLRRDLPQCFGPDASYEPLAPLGEHSGHVIAFERRHGPDLGVVVVVVRQPVGLGPDHRAWRPTTVPLAPGSWRNVLDDQAPTIVGPVDVDITSLIARFPAAVLIRTR